MKTKAFLLSIVFAGVALTASAQNKPDKKDDKKNKKTEMMENKKAQQAAYITRKIDLTFDEAQKFWPLYNEYEQKRSAIREQKRSDMKTAKENKNYDKMTDLFVDNKVKMAELQKDYNKKFKQVISAEKVMKFYEAEKDIRNKGKKDFPKHKQNRGQDRGDKNRMPTGNME